jgi:C4-dicarboxylate transporter, DctQ subunit
MLNPLLRLHDSLTELGFQLGKLCLGLIVFAYTFEVVSRYFFNSPTWWADELVSYSLSIGCFLMMPHVTRSNGHVAVTFLVDGLPAGGRQAAYRLIYLLCFFVCTVAFWINLDENIRQVVQDVHMMKVFPFPKIYISAFITYGFGMSALHFLRMVCRRGLSNAAGSGNGQVA